MTPSNTPAKILQNLLCRLLRARDGNVMMIMGFMLVPMIFAVGFGLDYGRAMRMQTKLAAIADAAALVAVSPNMMGQSDTEAVSAATAYFNAQASNLSGVTVTNVTITAPTTNSGALAGTRVATVSFRATSRNLFSTILGANTLPISGTVVANASQAPDINFTVLLDNSPSMLLPTTSDGLTRLKSVNNDCAFSCHINQIVYNDIRDSSNNIILLDRNYYNVGIQQVAGIYRYNGGSRKVYDGNNVQIGTNGSVNGARTTLSYKPNGSFSTTTVNTYPADPFFLAENYGKLYGSPASIPMRIDAELAAAQGLITTAQSTATALSTSNNTVIYKMQFYTFNYDVYAFTPSMTNVHSLNTAMLTPSNGTIAPYILWGGGYFPDNSNPSNAISTNYSDSSPIQGLGTINSVLATPGTGLNGSTPQQVLLIVTDGYQDELRGWQRRNQWDSDALAKCTAIKNRGIRIAILYTTYDPNTILPEYPGYAAVTPSIAPALRSCASPTQGGGALMYEVSVNEDISVALNRLFAMTVQTARLVQ